MTEDNALESSYKTLPETLAITIPALNKEFHIPYQKIAATVVQDRHALMEFVTALAKASEDAHGRFSSPATGFRQLLEKSI